MNATVTKSPVKSITLNLGEGPCDLCDKPVTFNASDLNGGSVWMAATDQLWKWSREAPEKDGENFGYLKTDYKIEWENGSKYAGRYDLMRFDDEEGGDGWELRNAIKGHAKWLMAVARYHLDKKTTVPDCIEKGINTMAELMAKVDM